MNASEGYAVFLFPQALEALGNAAKPYLTGQADGPHIFCKEIDTAGAFTEMTLVGQSPDGHGVELELMVPSSMIRMIVSAHSDGSFGFGPRPAVKTATPATPPITPVA